MRWVRQIPTKCAACGEEIEGASVYTVHATEDAVIVERWHPDHVPEVGVEEHQ